MTNTTYTRTETPGGGWTIRCNECRAKTGASPAFPRSESDVQHKTTCSAFRTIVATIVATPVVVTADQVRIAHEGGVTNSGLTEEEIVEAVNTGKLSANDALNRDY